MSLGFPRQEYWSRLPFLLQGIFPTQESNPRLLHCRLPTPVFLGFPGGSAGKESTCNEGDLGSIPELGRSPGEGNDYPLQHSGLEDSTDCIVHGVTKSRTQLSNFHFQPTQPHHHHSEFVDYMRIHPCTLLLLFRH